MDGQLFHNEEIKVKKKAEQDEDKPEAMSKHEGQGSSKEGIPDFQENQLKNEKHIRARIF